MEAILRSDGGGGRSRHLISAAVVKAGPLTTFALSQIERDAEGTARQCGPEPPVQDVQEPNGGYCGREREDDAARSPQ